jgi:hypothetical protein
LHKTYGPLKKKTKAGPAIPNKRKKKEEESLRYIPVKGITLQFSTSSGS